MKNATKKTARARAVDLLECIAQSGQTISALLRNEGVEKASDRALLAEIVYGVTRHHLYLQHVLSQNLKKPLRKLPLPLVVILQVAAYQLLFLDKIPAYAIIWEAVEEVKRRYGQMMARLANGVLRAIEREQEKWIWHPKIGDSLQLNDLAVYYSFPEWLVARWQKYLGEAELVELFTFLNERPTQTLRCNETKLTKDEIKSILEKEGLNAQTNPHLKSALILENDKIDRAHSLYEQGAVSFQSLSSQWVVSLLARLLKPGDRCLDACAGAGGKVLAVAELWKEACSYEAYDPKPAACADLEREKIRLGLPWVTVLSHPLDQSVVSTWDVVLVDAPCSGLGTIGKNPELKWRRAPEDLKRFGDKQLEILAYYAGAVKPGGTLVYSVCSVEPEENEDVIAAFLKGHPEFERHRPSLWIGIKEVALEVDGGWKLFPHRVRSEGFFISCLRRKDQRFLIDDRP